MFKIHCSFKFHVFRRKTLPTNDFELTVPNLYYQKNHNSLFQVTLIGDSHMRYWFYYILIRLGLLPRNVPQKLMDSMDVENLGFRWGHFMVYLIDKVKAEIKRLENATGNTPSLKHNRKRKRKPLLIINAIDWDMLHGSMAGYFTEVYKLVELLKGVVKKNNIRVLYLSGVAFNNKNKPREWPFLGYIFRAVNQVVLEKMEYIGVETINVNTMLFSVNGYPVYTDHYLQVVPQHQVIYGTFGPGAADRILHHICTGA